jgi:predicted GNAT family acetyltransferase
MDRTDTASLIEELLQRLKQDKLGSTGLIDALEMLLVKSLRTKHSALMTARDQVRASRELLTQFHESEVIRDAYSRLLSEIETEINQYAKEIQDDHR